jgi:hypothetical protein
MPLRNFDRDLSEDEYLLERQLSVTDNDMAYAIVLCVVILGGICMCIKINSWVTAAKRADQELNEARADHFGGDDDDEEAPPLKTTKKEKKKKKKKLSSEKKEKSSLKK